VRDSSFLRKRCPHFSVASRDTCTKTSAVLEWCVCVWIWVFRGGGGICASATTPTKRLGACGLKATALLQYSGYRPTLPQASKEVGTFKISHLPVIATPPAVPPPCPPGECTPDPPKHAHTVL